MFGIGNADAGVAHRTAYEAQADIRRRIKADIDQHVACVRELDCVSDQIEEHLPHASGVAVQIAGAIRGDAQKDLQAARFGGAAEQFRRFLHGVAEVERHHFDAEFAGLDLGEVEDVVDERE